MTLVLGLGLRPNESSLGYRLEAFCMTEGSRLLEDRKKGGPMSVFGRQYLLKVLVEWIQF